eukprot:43121-Chlamydomonas_euryale.AAC.4
MPPSPHTHVRCNDPRPPRHSRMSLISTWKTPESSRQFYDARQSQQLDAKLRVPGLGPAMLQHLAAGDLGGDHTGLCSKQCLLQTALLHFGVLLTPGELECLKAEWQVMDHATGNVRCGVGQFPRKDGGMAVDRWEWGVGGRGPRNPKRTLRLACSRGSGV